MPESWALVPSVLYFKTWLKGMGMGCANSGTERYQDPAVGAAVVPGDPGEGSEPYSRHADRVRTVQYSTCVVGVVV